MLKWSSTYIFRKGLRCSRSQAQAPGRHLSLVFETLSTLTEKGIVNELCIILGAGPGRNGGNLRLDRQNSDR